MMLCVLFILRKVEYYNEILQVFLISIIMYTIMQNTCLICQDMVCFLCLFYRKINILYFCSDAEVIAPKIISNGLKNILKECLKNILNMT